MVAVVVIMDGNYAFLKARGQRTKVKMKVPFVTTSVHATVVAIDEITNGEYAVLKAHGPCSVMRGGKRKNNGYKGTNRH